MYEVIMPKMGETMETGIIEKWRKKEGDKVEKGEILYDLATDKVSLEVESFFTGILRKIVKTEGEEVPIMEIIAYIGEKDEPLPGVGDTSKAELATETVKAQQAKVEEKTPAADINNTTINMTASEAEAERVSISPLS